MTKLSKIFCLLRSVKPVAAIRSLRPIAALGSLRPSKPTSEHNQETPSA